MDAIDSTKETPRPKPPACPFCGGNDTLEAYKAPIVVLPWAIRCRACGTGRAAIPL
jgi:hypothetical protein